MASFLLTLANEAHLSGICSLPAKNSTTSQHRPLVVGIHGGSYSSKYFDALPENSAVAISETLGIPFVAIDRPGYDDSSSLPEIPSGSTYLQEEGKYLHRYILPRIWKEYGQSSGATTIVVLAHSLGSGGAIVAAALHSQETEPQYPYGGIIISGWGAVKLPATSNIKEMLDKHESVGRITYEIEAKDRRMLCYPQMSLVGAEMVRLSGALNKPVGVGELRDVHFQWLQYWETYSTQVRIPVMASVAERDSIWEGSQTATQTFGNGFPNSKRVETGVVEGAPHCIELSHWASGWLLRCFGFAIECAASAGTELKEGEESRKP